MSSMAPNTRRVSSSPAMPSASISTSASSTSITPALVTAWFTSSSDAATCTASTSGRLGTDTETMRVGSPA